jgi:hypothetical protein
MSELALDEALRDSVVTKPVFALEMASLRLEMAKLKLDLTVRMGVMSAAVVGILTGIRFFG